MVQSSSQVKNKTRPQLFDKTSHVFYFLDRQLMFDVCMKYCIEITAFFFLHIFCNSVFFVCVLGIKPKKVNDIVTVSACSLSWISFGCTGAGFKTWGQFCASSHQHVPDVDRSGERSGQWNPIQEEILWFTRTSVQTKPAQILRLRPSLKPEQKCCTLPKLKRR